MHQMTIFWLRWDVERYNGLKEGIGSIEADLRRIRDPLGVHAPSKVQQKKVSSGLFGIGNLRDMVSKMQ